MKRKLLLVVLLAVGGASLVATGAFTDRPAQTEGIELSPSDGPNSAYAVNDSGEIRLDLSESTQLRAVDATGVTDDSVTTVANIFTVTYNGSVDDPPATVWFETPDVPAYEDIEFVQGTDSVESIHGQGHSRTLSPGETTHVGVVIDTTGDHELDAIEEFTFVAERDSPSTAGETADSDEPLNTGPDSGGESGSTDTGSGDSGADPDPPDVDQGTGSTDGTDSTDDGDTGDNETEIGPDEDREGNESGTEQTGTLTEPALPGPQTTLGGFPYWTLLLLLLFVVAGAGLFSVTRRGLTRET